MGWPLTVSDQLRAEGSWLIGASPCARNSPVETRVATTNNGVSLCPISDIVFLHDMQGDESDSVAHPFWILPCPDGVSGDFRFWIEESVAQFVSQSRVEETERLKD